MIEKDIRIIIFLTNWIKTLIIQTMLLKIVKKKKRNRVASQAPHPSAVFMPSRGISFVNKALKRKECGKIEIKLEDKRIKINSDCLLAVSLTQSLHLTSNNKSTTRDSNFTLITL